MYKQLPLVADTETNLHYSDNSRLFKHKTNKNYISLCVCVCVMQAMNEWMNECLTTPQHEKQIGYWVSEEGKRMKWLKWLCTHALAHMLIHKHIKSTTVAQWYKPSTDAWAVGHCQWITGGFLETKNHSNAYYYMCVKWFVNFFHKIFPYELGAGRNSEVEHSLMVRWVVGSILHGVDPLCSMTGVTKAVVCVILSVGWCM